MYNPIEIFQNNWQIAKSSKDTNAHYCSLSTVSTDNQVSSRTLVLRGVTKDSFTLFFDSTSPKWQQLKSANSFELLVFWPSLMQQYRIRGQYSTIEPSVMQNHWKMKPYNSKILDHFRAQYKTQSSSLNSRDELLIGIEALKNRFSHAEDIPFPSNATGISIKANYMETWQGSDTDLLHERHLYTLLDGVWNRKILVP